MKISQFTPRIIILEGCDRCGKSTLGEDLAYALNAHLIHYGKPTKLESEDVVGWMINPIKKLLDEEPKRPIIIDRFHLSNIVYGYLFKHVYLNKSHFHQIENFLEQHKSVIIHCYRELDDLKLVWDNNEMYSFKSAQNILQCFEYMMQKTNLPVLKYNFDKEEFLLSNINKVCLSASIME